MRRILFFLWRVLVRNTSMQSFMLHVVGPFFSVGATAVILDERGSILLFHHRYRAFNSWGAPGGLLRRGEDARVALAREVAEESGMAVEIGPPLHIDTVRGHAVIEMIYLAKWLGGEFRPSGEVDEGRWFGPKDELPADMKGVQKMVVRNIRERFAQGRLPN